MTIFIPCQADPSELTREYITKRLEELPLFARSMVEAQVWRDFDRYIELKNAGLKRDLIIKRDDIFSKLAEIADLSTWRYCLNLSRVYREEALVPVLAALSTNGTKFVTYTSFGDDVFWRRYFSEANEERVQNECEGQPCLGVRVVDMNDEISSEMIVNTQNVELVSKVPSIDSKLKQDLGQLLVEEPWDDLKKNIAEVIFNSFNSAGLSAEDGILGSETAVFNYIVSDDDAWYRRKEYPYTPITPNPRSNIITQGTQIAVLDDTFDAKNRKVAQIKFKNDSIEFNTLSNLTQVVDMTREIKFKTIEDYEAKVLPYSTLETGQTYKKDQEFVASKRCGDYIKVKGEGGDIEGHWIEVSATQGLEPEFPITTQEIKEIFPNADNSRIEAVVQAINNHSTDFEITSKNRMAHFLAQIGAETGGLNELSESEFYSPRRVVELFGIPKYADLFQGYVSDPKECVGVTYLEDGSTLGSGRPGPVNPDFPYESKQAIVTGYSHPTTDVTVGNLRTKVAKSYNEGILKLKSNYYGQGAKLFDVTYSCRLGNAGPGSGDGTKYKGKGFIHLTGRYNYKEVSKKWNAKYPNDKKEFHGNDIVLLETDVDVAIKVSLIFWELRNINIVADEGTGDEVVSAVTQLVNGGSNGLIERKKYAKKAFEILTDDD